MSTTQERQFQIYESYHKAYSRRASDWKEAKTEAQANAISDNVELLENHYLDAAKNALDANGGAVEAAYDAASEARQAVEEAYGAAKGIATKIRLVGKLAGTVGNLLNKAAGL